MTADQMLAQLNRRFDALSFRERMLIVIAAAAVVFTAWSMLLLDPLELEQRAAIAHLEQSAEDVAVLRDQLQRVKAGLPAAGAAMLRKQEVELAAQIEQLDARLERHQAMLVSPDQAVKVLAELLRRQSGLTLSRLETENSAPVELDLVEGTKRLSTGGRGLYRHVIAIEAAGGYFDTLDYLRELERLPWGIRLEHLDFEVVEHPTARIRLRVQMLSQERDWIGA